MAEFIIRRRLAQLGERRTKPTVHISVVVEPGLADLLRLYFGHEVLLQKPIMFGSLPLHMGRTASGLPQNTHLINFLRGGDTVVITVDALLSGYSFEAQSIWDAIAFEEFSKTAFDRFQMICRHAQNYVTDAPCPTIAN